MIARILFFSFCGSGGDFGSLFIEEKHADAVDIECFIYLVLLSLLLL